MRLLTVCLGAAVLAFGPALAPAQSAVSPVRTAVIAQDVGTATIQGVAQESPKPVEPPAIDVWVNVDAECVIRLASPGTSPVPNTCKIDGPWDEPMATVYADNQMLIARVTVGYPLNADLKLCVRGICKALGLPA